MRDLQKILDECICDVKALGIPIGNIEKIEWVDFEKQWGRSIYHVLSDTHTIQISSRCKSENILLKDLKNIIFHEIIHTCNDCLIHNELFAKYAAMIDEHYGYEVSITKSTFDFLNPDAPILCKMVCRNCGSKQEIRDDLIYENIKNGSDIFCKWCKSKMEIL